MKVFIVSLLLPDSWCEQDAVVACNLGIKRMAENHRWPLSAIDYNSRVIDEYRLREVREGQERAPDEP